MKLHKVVAASALVVGLTPVGSALVSNGHLAAAAPAVACDPNSDYPPGCTTTTSSTVPEGDLIVELLSPLCLNDVPYLTYSVTFPGGTATTATITFVNPTGASYVVSGVPLQGQILWPGAVVNSAGEPIDWPGWTQQADGTWVPGDEWNWAAVPNLTIIIEVNPTASGTVSYPEATPACVAGPRTPPTPEDPGGDPRTLPATGSDTTVVLATAGLATLLLGAALTFVARRRTSGLTQAS